MTVDEKALQAAIPVGSNIADAHLVRAIIAAYEAAKGGGAPAADSTRPFSEEELAAVYAGPHAQKAIDLVFGSQDGMTIGELRSKLRRLAPADISDIRKARE